MSDGSYYPFEDVGACAWIILTPDGKEIVQGGGVIPGLRKDQNSYRAELDDQLGITVIVESVDVPQGAYQIKTVCDGLAALNKVGTGPEYVKGSAKYVDMISMISDMWNKSAITPMPKHVYVYQDASKNHYQCLQY